MTVRSQNISKARWTTLLWSALLFLTVLWPDPAIAPLDGIPLDGRLEAITLGLLLPSLWWLYPRFLETRAARWPIVALAVWKCFMIFAVPQGGWCAQFVAQESTIPVPTGAPNETAEPTLLGAWDVRTGFPFRSPRCSAVMSRPYGNTYEFPLWVTNWFGAAGRPPAGHIDMHVTGYLTSRHQGELSFAVGPEMTIEGSVGSADIHVDGDRVAPVPVEAGSHRVELDVTLAGPTWRFTPLWNGQNLWAETVSASTTPVGGVDITLRTIGSWATPLFLLTLAGAWIVAICRAYRPSYALLAWMLAAASWMSFAGGSSFERFAPALLLGAAWVPVGRRLRNLRGAFLLIGIPWMSGIATKYVAWVGQYNLYSIGDDWLAFQLFAHRIFMDGYWLQGGEKAFWFQPLYRWTVGTLHLIFGDSSVGEVYWDAAALLIATLFCFYVVKRMVGFRWGICAAVATLATYTVGPGWYFIGRGESSISAVGLAYLAGFFLLRARAGWWSAAAVAGLCSVLMFYTRLNQVLFAASFIALVLPLNSKSQGWPMLKRYCMRRSTMRVIALYVGCLELGVFLFALRTWYYTGTFSVLYGTTAAESHLSPGLAFSMLDSWEVWRHALGNLLALVTLQVPARLDIRATLVVAGVACAALSILRCPGFRRLPLGICLMCLGSLIFAFFGLAPAYSGRFSLHVIPVATALTFVAAGMFGPWVVSSGRNVFSPKTVDLAFLDAHRHPPDTRA